MGAVVVRVAGDGPRSIDGSSDCACASAACAAGFDLPLRAIVAVMIAVEATRITAPQAMSTPSDRGPNRRFVTAGTSSGETAASGNSTLVPPSTSI
jgi:hypothetical protein